MKHRPTNRCSLHSLHSLHSLYRTALLIAAACAAPALAGDGAALVDWHEGPIEVAAGEAHQGPWRMNASDFRYVDDPTVALDASGIAGVAWVDQARQDVFFQRYGADGAAQLETPVNVSRSTGIFSWLPRVVFGDDDGEIVHVLWQDIVFSGGSHGGEIFYARSRDGGRAFDPPVNLSNTMAGAGKGRLSRRDWHNGSVDLAVGDAGAVYAAWTEYEGALRVARSNDGGRSFAEPVQIAEAPDGHPARAPSIAVAGRTVYVAWTVGEDAGADIHVARSDDSGASFGDRRIVHASAAHADAPKLAVDEDDIVHVVYAERPTGRGRGYHVVHARSHDRGVTWSTPADISGAHRSRFDGVHFPALGRDGDGRLFVLWELYPAAHGRARGLGVTCSADGARFAEPVVVPDSDASALGFNGNLQGQLMNKLAVNAAGSIAVVHSTFNPSQRSHVWLYRGEAGHCGAEP